MHEKFNIITHITTACNYNCSYCDVIKDGRRISSANRECIISFIKRNRDYIGRFKFFWGEPLIWFKDIKYIIEATHDDIWNNFEIVTNTTLLNDEVGDYFSKYFSHIFFSIDSENKFDYNMVLSFIEKYQLEEKLYFNVVISPWKENIALEQFKKLYKQGMRGYNILPVYFTQPWTSENLRSLSSIMKYILDLSIQDPTLRLYWFRENLWYDTSLANNTIFNDVDGKVYYSDMVSTFIWKKISNKLFIWDIDSMSLWDISAWTFKVYGEEIKKLEDEVYWRIQGQRELHKIMDYFSTYLNKKSIK